MNQTELFEEKSHNEKYLYLPMHQDNLCFFLSSGYIGGAVDKKRFTDFQNSTGYKIAGFKELPPLWALEYGESELSAKVVVKVKVDYSNFALIDSYFVSNKLLRITDAICIYFSSEDALRNFDASFKAFSNVPIDLIQKDLKASNEFPLGEKLKLERKENAEFQKERVTKDIVLALTASSLSLLETSSEFRRIEKLFSESSKDPQQDPIERLIMLILNICDAEPENIDFLIWVITAKMIFKHKEEQAFSKYDLLASIEKEVFAVEEDKKTLEDFKVWAETVRQILDTEIDLPEFDDSRNIGRRAALYLLLYPTNTEVRSLMENKIVSSLIGIMIFQVSSAFEGFSRIKSHWKSNFDQFKLLLKLADRLERGKETLFQVSGSTTNPQLLTETVTYNFRQQKAFQRTERAPYYVLALAKFIGNQKIELAKDRETGFYKLICSNSLSITCNPRKQKNKEAIMFYTSLDVEKNHENIKKLLVQAFDLGLAVGIIDNKETSSLCVFSQLLTHTLDQDEFDSMVDQIKNFKNLIEKA